VGETENASHTEKLTLPTTQRPKCSIVIRRNII